MQPGSGAVRGLLRLLGLVLVSTLALQLYFLARVALMRVVDPQSTTFQRSEIGRIVAAQGRLPWRQDWVGYARIADSLKRAVVAAEDARFGEHSGIEWDALEKAWERNEKAEAAVERLNEQAARRHAAPRDGGRSATGDAGAGRASDSARHGAGAAHAAAGSRAAGPGARAPASPAPRMAPRIVGGSTITQQLAKNLFLSSERSLARKSQEFVITTFLEVMLSKQRILEIYLNSVEWGEGVFGAEAAAAHYFRVPAAALEPAQAARLAVMLPAPKRFERRPASPYVLSRASIVLARMGAVHLP